MVKHSKIYYEKLASLFERCFLFLFTFFGAQLGYWVNFVIDGKTSWASFVSIFSGNDSKLSYMWDLLDCGIWLLD
ncbi:MAG: hypothetical protein SPK55_10570 [Succinivibrio sp.]|nr:hypothetical protein [Succinivibrio sp.]